MARVGGRSTWFAWLVGLTCGVVVATLAWLSLPALPSAANWVGELLRGPPPAVDRSPADPAAADPPSSAAVRAMPEDCRALYPDGLWILLEETPGASLAEGADVSGILDPTLVEQTGATISVACRWEADGSSVATSVARVDDEAAALVADALAGRGFACSAVPGGVRCEHSAGDLTEVHDVRTGVWIATIQDGWHPPDYDILVTQRVRSSLTG